MASCRNSELERTESAAPATLARSLAPEEIRVGDYVTPLSTVIEVPSYWWPADGWSMRHDEPVRVRVLNTCDGVPLRVKAVCLPFALVKRPTGRMMTLDTRQCQFARLDPAYGKRAWKTLK